MSNAADTGQGFLVGVEPAQPRQANDYVEQRPAQQVSQPVQQQPPPQQPPPQPQGRFTEEDIERARQQEKDKLYGRIEELSTGLKSMQEERQTEMAERQRLAEEAEAARRAKEEGEMEVRELLSKREQEWENRFQQTQAQYEADRAIFDQERRLAEVANYRRDRIEQEREFILPELQEFVGGGTPEEIDQSIDELKRRSESIISNIAATYQPPRMGAIPSVPPVGPMEQLPEYEQLTPEDIRGMDMKTYTRYREQLLRATSPRRQQ